MKIDINKRYRYTDGDKARILCIDAPGEYPVVSIDCRGLLWTHTAEGTTPLRPRNLILDEHFPVSLENAYQTKNGYEVRIYAIDHIGDNPVCGVIKTQDGWDLTTWTLNGKYVNDSTETEYDLVPKE